MHGCHRRISTNPVCPLCYAEKKIILHALWGCNSLLPVRNGVSPSFDLWHRRYPSFLEFLLSCFSQLRWEEFKVLIVIFWRVWYRRNRAIHDLCLLNAADISPWHHSSSSCLKLNIDASVQNSSGMAGLGAIVHDAAGQVLLAGACNASPCLDVAFAEVAAIRFRLLLSKDAGLLPLQVESDYQSVVNNILAKCIPLSEIGLVLKDILIIFDECQVESISFIPRSANKRAQSLAHLGCSISDFSI
ncbi:hypothetical protein ACOSQ3_014807 [Xanthoceras sorbifolium]